MKIQHKLFLLFISFSLLAIHLPAQKRNNTRKSAKKSSAAVTNAAKKSEDQVAISADTAAPKVVVITSAFKPYLKNAAKVNFTAATPVIDSTKIPVTYKIPYQNLFFSYQPVTIKPLALAFDTSFDWHNDLYIKVGAGNFSSIYGEAGFSFGDGKNSITNLKGNFSTATGHLPSQQAAKWGIDVVSIFHTAGNNEWTAHPYYKSATQYYYGYQPANLPYAKDQLEQRFNTVGMELGLQNKAPNAYGITYHPQVHFVRFTDTKENQESNIIIKAPIKKSFGSIYALNLEMVADLSNTDIPLIPNPYHFKNNLIYVNPAIQFTTPNMRLNLGIRPTWDNQQYSTLPDITVEAKIPGTNLMLEAGWKGYYQKNTLRSLAGYNPWIGALNNLENTKIREQYAGFKIATGEHFSYQASVSFLQLNNQPLFLNNGIDGKSFSVLFEPEMKAFRLHGEANYTFQETISIMAGVTYSQYSSLVVNEKAWGLPPLEATGSLKWKILKDLQVKADLFVFDGNPYKTVGALNYQKTGAFADCNLGAEFTVLPKLNIWLQMNNIFNTTYQRWNQYPVLGAQVLAGVVYSFR